MLRLKSEIWVAALLRRCAAQGQFGAVVHHGADEAGIIYVCINRLNGLYDLLSPPPGPAYDDTGERRFALHFQTPVDWPTASAVIAKQRKSDPDLWAVEIEVREGFAGIMIET